MRQFISICMTLFAAMILSALTGCASDGGRIAEGREAVESFRDMRASIARGRAQVDQVSRSLQMLASGQDLRKAYRKFNSEVGDLHRAAADARKRADAMRQSQQAFVTAWQKEMATLSDPTLKSTLEQRREAVAANYDHVRAAGQDAHDAYVPYVNHLREIQTALSIDLTPQTVAGISSPVEQVQAEGETLKQKLAAFDEELRRIEMGLSPAANATR